MSFKERLLILIFVIFFKIELIGQFNEYHPQVNWFTIETEHFAVHFHEGAERTAKVIAKIAEEIYKPITDFYGYKPEKVHFVIKDIDDYSNGVTYFFDNKIEIWAPPLDTDLRGTHNWLRNVIAHEFTHMVQIQATMKFKRTFPAFYFQVLNYERERRPDVLYGFPNVVISYPTPIVNVPAWFAEGTAQYMRNEFKYDYWDSHRDMILRCYVLNDKILTWNEMTVFEKNSLGNEAVYNHGFALVSYIAMRYGEKKLIEINNRLKDKLAFTIDEAIYKALGISGIQLYNEWKSFLKEYYLINTQKIRDNLFEGKILEKEGFGNFFPVFSKDGSKVYYLSNKNEDYFITSLYEYDLKTNTSKLIQPGINSAISISPGNDKIYYARLTEKNKHFVKIHDLYVYDLTRKKETRLTYGLRANYPTLSPDGKTIAYLSQKDGTLNIFLIDSDGQNNRKLTEFKNGEQIFSLRFSPKGDKIIFDYSLKDARDIACVDLNGTIQTVLNHPEIDERNPVYLDSNRIIYSSNEKGIFNLFIYNLVTGEKKQITNVIGGAFMPDFNFENKIVYAGYTAEGYRIFFIENFDNVSLDDAHTYDYKIYSISQDKKYNGKFNWEALRNFDDSNIPNFNVEKYSASYSKLSFIPFLRYDNYSRTAKGLALIKPGIYFYSDEILNRFGIFGSAAINSRLERDVYFGLTYRDKIPILWNIGLKPEMNFELYSVSRKADYTLGLFPDTLSDGTINYGYTTPIKITYNLFEVNISAKNYIFSKNQSLTLKTIYSRYSADLSSFLLPDYTLYPATYEIYLKGFTFSAIYEFENIARKKDSDINPIGTRIHLNLEYSTNDFNPETYYDENEGQLLTRYGKTKFARIELNTMQAFKLPAWKHTLTLKTRAGTILGPEVDNFFDFYLGGLIGMRSYPFYSISGNEIFHVSLNYRFPIYENIDTRLYHLYLDKIYGSIYFDFGNAWQTKEVKFKDFKRGVGVELRLQMNSFYLFPTSIFINVNYGIDEFKRLNPFTKETIKYGKEILIYFGMLFGFEF